MGVIEAYLAATGLGCVLFAVLGSREGRTGPNLPTRHRMDRAA